MPLPAVGKELPPSFLPVAQVLSKKVRLIILNIEWGVHSQIWPAWLLTGAKVWSLIQNKVGGGRGGRCEGAKKREAAVRQRIPSVC